MAAETFADWLQAQMKAAGISQSELAYALGMKSSSSVSRWLAFGARPDPLICELLAERFGADVLWLLRLAGHLRPKAEDDESMAESRERYEVLEFAKVATIARQLHEANPARLREWLQIGELLLKNTLC